MAFRTYWEALLAIVVACATQPPAPSSSITSTSPIPAASRQLIVGLSTAWTDVPVELHRFERDAGGRWHAIDGTWSAVIGHAGLAWGRGLHGDGVPAGETGDVKVEGDGRTPAGVFALGASYGYADEPPANTAIRYSELSDTWRCVDDSTSEHYNRVFDAAGMSETWTSAERMRRKDDLYQWVIAIDHNHVNRRPGAPVKPTPKGGSCIFFHVWSGQDSATVGCTALATPDIESLLAWLRPGAHPVYVLLPYDVYNRVTPAWGLPQLSPPAL